MFLIRIDESYDVFALSFFCRVPEILLEASRIKKLTEKGSFS